MPWQGGEEAPTSNPVDTCEAELLSALQDEKVDLHHDADD